MIPKKDLPTLMNAAYYGFNRGLDGDFKPIQTVDGGTTFCNKFIAYICNYFGYDAFTGMTANEMVAFMKKAESGWITVSDAVAQQHANSGVIVIAGWSNPAGHGHVNLIVPGILEYSASFGKDVPKSVNVGADVYFGKRVSFGFGVERMPEYFALAGQI